MAVGELVVLVGCFGANTAHAQERTALLPRADGQSILAVTNTGYSRLEMTFSAERCGQWRVFASSPLSTSGSGGHDGALKHRARLLVL